MNIKAFIIYFKSLKQSTIETERERKREREEKARVILMNWALL